MCRKNRSQWRPSFPGFNQPDATADSSPVPPICEYDPRNACMGVCTNLETDPHRRGGCDVACTPGQFCSWGVCTSTCAQGLFKRMHRRQLRLFASSGSVGRPRERRVQLSRPVVHRYSASLRMHLCGMQSTMHRYANGSLQLRHLRKVVRSRSSLQVSAVRLLRPSTHVLRKPVRGHPGLRPELRSVRTCMSDGHLLHGRSVSIASPYLTRSIDLPRVSNTVLVGPTSSPGP